jgi:hypothetical protein
MARNSLILLAACNWVWAVPLAQAQTVRPSSDSQITFVSRRSGGNLLYVMNPDGTALKPIFGGPLANVPMVVEGTTLYRAPHWSRQSPDRRHFASWVTDEGKPYERYQGTVRFMLYAGGIDKSWTKVVNPDCHEEFAWSPDSQRIAFSVFSGEGHSQGYLRNKMRSTEVAVCGRDGSNEDFVLEQPGITIVLDWSPDGSRLLLERRYFDIQPKRSSDILEFRLADAIAARSRMRGADASSLRGSIWAANSAGSYLKPLVAGTKQMDFDDARYSPNGKSIALVFADPEKMYALNEVADDESGRSNMMRFLGKLAVMEIATGEMKTIVNDSEGLRGPICWSPDGNEILFSRYLPKGDIREKMPKEHGLAIWGIRKDGTGARMITTGWSPDWR